MSKDGEVISELNGNVVFLYDDAVIKSEYAKWWKSRGVVSFSNKVQILRKTQKLTSDHVDYDKNKKWLITNGNLDFYDTKERVKLTGDHGTYFLDKKFLVVEGRPRFVFYDTTAHDTLDITGKKMTYDDSLKKASVYDDVAVKKGKLFTQSNEAFYYPDSGNAQLRMTPKIAFETDSLRGDSVDLTFTKKHLKQVKVKGQGHGQYKDFGASDTTLTHLLGDSISMFLTDSGKIDSLWAFGSVKSKYYPIKNPLATNEAFGKQMTVSFNNRGEVSRSMDFRAPSGLRAGRRGPLAVRHSIGPSPSRQATRSPTEAGTAAAASPRSSARARPGPPRPGPPPAGAGWAR